MQCSLFLSKQSSNSAHQNDQQISSNLAYRTFPISHTDPPPFHSAQLCFQQDLKAL